MSSLAAKRFGDKAKAAQEGLSRVLGSQPVLSTGQVAEPQPSAAACGAPLPAPGQRVGHLALVGARSKGKQLSCA